MTDLNPATVNVIFQKQGGQTAPGVAVGRQGMSRFLIQYRINSGAGRERWISRDRIIGLDDGALSADRALLEQLETLPRFVKRECPAPMRVTAQVYVGGGVMKDAGYCDVCGGGLKTVGHKAVQPVAEPKPEQGSDMPIVDDYLEALRLSKTAKTYQARSRNDAKAARLLGSMTADAMREAGRRLTEYASDRREAGERFEGSL